ncbi:MAG: hypothetical protein IJJ26_13345 [Victivallales bacterium]|nr:hypothetical protein [Victivallales bacterium]
MSRSIPLLFFLLLFSLHAALLRIDVMSPETPIQVTSTDKLITPKPMGWQKQYPPSHTAYFHKNAIPDKWLPATFTVLPKKDGTLEVHLMGEWRPDENGKLLPVAFFISQFRVNQKLHKFPESSPRLVTDPGLCLNGEQTLRTWHEDREIVKLPLVAGQPLQISFQYRDAGFLTVQPDVTPLPLGANANRTFGDETEGDHKGGWSDQGEQSLRNLQPQCSYGGMEFAIPTTGNQVATLHSQYDPTELREFTLSLKAPKTHSYLYLLHAACWLVAPDVGTVQVHYADGTSQDFPVRRTLNVADWWSVAELEQGKIVYVQNPEERQGGFFLTRFPLRRKPIQAVTFRTTEKAVWIIVAASLSSRDVPVSSGAYFIPQAPDFLPCDKPNNDIRPGTALDWSKRLPPVNAFGKGHRWIGANGFVPVYVFIQEETSAAHAAIDSRFEQLHLLGYDYFRTNYHLDRWPFQDAPADLQFAPKYLDLYDYYVDSATRHHVRIWGTLASYQFGRKSWRPAFDLRNDWKALCFFGDERFRDDWSRLVKMLLTHYNPYQKCTYMDSPAFFIWEPYNEQEIGLRSWLSEVLRPETMAAIVPIYAKFLRKKYGTPEKLAAAWHCKPGTFEELAALPHAQMSNVDRWEFAMEHLRECQAFYAKELRALGAKQPISQYNLSYFKNASIVRAESVDVVCMNAYFNHPSNFQQPGSVVAQNSSLGNARMSYFRNLIGTRLADRPFVVTEYNQPYWNQYYYERGLAFAAYSALQGLEGITVHAGAVAHSPDQQHAVECFTVFSSPTQRANEFLTMAIYRRGDVKTSPHRVELLIQEDPAEGMTAIGAPETQLSFLTGLAVRTPATRTVPADCQIEVKNKAQFSSTNWAATLAEKNNDEELANLVAKLREKGVLAPDNKTDISNGIFVSDTGEITFDTKQKRIQVITDLTEGLTLAAGEVDIPLRVLRIEEVTSNCAVAAVSIDGRPLRDSERVVLVINTFSCAPGLKLSTDRTAFYERGSGASVLMQTVVCKGTLQNTNAKRLRLYPLALDGTRRDPLPITTDNNLLRFDINTAKLPNGTTPFFELALD